MKKTLFLLSLFVGSLTLNAQFTLEDADGTLIPDGTILTFNTYEYPDASWDFHVNNTSDSESIRTKIEFVSAINANGSMMELCYGLCYTGISIGQILPPGNDYVEILPGEQTGFGNHIYNSDPGNGSDALTYVFRYFQIDDSGNEIGEDLTVTYFYDPLLGLNDVNSLNFSVNATVVTDELVINTQEELTLQVFDILGKQVILKELSIGEQRISMSHLNPQMYVMQLTNNKGATEVVKVIVK
jgi:hypothetical protein